MQNNRNSIYRIFLKYIPAVTLLFAGACAARGMIRPEASGRAATAAFAATASETVSRQEFFKAAQDPAEKNADRDDFIEVDDKHGLKKSWPMVLFVALLAVAIGAL